MKTEELIKYIDCRLQDDGKYRVKSRERADLEFKQAISDNNIRKCVKTVAAFANTDGGSIVFGVTNSPREICGVDINEWPDEATLQDIFHNHLVPCPNFNVFEHQLDENHLIELRVDKADKQPVIATKELQTAEAKNKTVLRRGVVYYRRAGQSREITGEEFTAILHRRDEQIHNTILSFIMRGNSIGFENATVADFRKYGSNQENVTLYVPSEAANDLNIIDRAKLVETGGAPAYEIRGSIALTTASSKDPRKPALPDASVRALRPEIKKNFGNWFPWAANHLRLAATHLGFWPTNEGDETHTAQNEVSKSPVYFEQGRVAVLKFAKANPDEFVDVVGSKKTKNEWRKLRNKNLE